MTTRTKAAPPLVQRLLDAWSAFGGRPIQTLTADQARSQPALSAAVDVVLRKLGRPTEPQSVASVSEIRVPGAGGDLPARVYRPAGEGPFPILVYFPGGGWVLGGLAEYDRSARALANAGGCVVISIGYRQAPEHPYPAALFDAYAAYNHVGENAEKFEGDRRRVAVAGEGSGANLAGAVSLMAMPVHQVLICPIVSLDFEAPSYRTNANARPYGTAAIKWFAQQYLSKKKDRQSPYLNLMTKRGIDLPSTTLIVAELDPLASEGQAYHKHLLAAAVDSELGLYRGVTADFFGTGAVVAKAKKAVEFTGKRLRKAFTISRPNRR